MPTTKAKTHIPRQMGPRCAAIPGWMHARRDLARTRSELAKVAALVQETGGLVPRTEKDHHPDALANLWFLRAIHEFGLALSARGNGEADAAAFFQGTLIPAAKKILQQFISGEIEGMRMDDGGLLVGGLAAAQDLRVNALWYSALEMTGTMLKAAKDAHSSHHYERLAGRFRRSFAKTYWCPDHDCICPPAVRDLPDHGKLPDPDQLLVTMLPASPLPRTKQRQILLRIQQNSLGELGVRREHPEHGTVESPLHQVWLARGVAVENAEARVKAVALLEPLGVFWDRARKMLVHAAYRDGHLVPPGGKPDPLTSAEVLGALEEFGIKEK